MKYIPTLALLLGLSLLAANPAFVPLTSIAEDFSATWCGGCQLAFAGLDVVHTNTHPGEFISARLYTESADLSSPSVDARFNHYSVIGIPVVIFNGKTRIDGSNDQTSSGSEYMNALRPYLHGAAPVKIDISSFNPSTGAISGSVEMIAATLTLTDENFHIYLLEDDVTTQDTHVTRQIITQSISLGGAGNTWNFNASFTVNPSWNPAKLWAAAFIQMPNNTILQTGHTLPLPANNVRAAFDWDSNIVVPAGVPNFESQTFYVFNLGVADDFTTRIVRDEVPDDWYFNYCDEEGFCYPGDTPINVNIPPGTAKAFHFSFYLSTSNLARFRFVINSPTLGDYSIPFHIRTSDMVSSDDPLAPVANLSLAANHPNPFPFQTTLNVQSPKAMSSATVEIFNLRGQKVDSVTLNNLNSGLNTATWTPSSTLPSGIYFQKLAGSSQPPRRMLLLK